MNWKALLPSIFALVALAALGGYALYDDLEYQEKRRFREEIIARQEFVPKVDKQMTQAEGVTKQEKQTVASALSEGVRFIPENESDIHQFREVPSNLGPLGSMEISSTESETNLEPQILESSGQEGLGLPRSSVLPNESGAESKDEKKPTIASVEGEPTIGNPATVQRSAIVPGVESREPQGICESVSVQQGRVYCWVHVRDGEGRKVIIRWIANGRELWETPLPVGSNDWRTWAYITLRPNMIGQAQADILNEDGQLLKTESFEIKE